MTEGDKVRVKYTQVEGKKIASAITKDVGEKETKKGAKSGAKPIERVRTKR